MANPNFQLLADDAKPLLGELVFVGGRTTGLLITDKAVTDVLALCAERNTVASRTLLGYA